MRSVLGTTLVLACFASFQSGEAVQAQEWWHTSKDGIPDVSIATSLHNNGDPAGIRKRLGEYGMVYGLEYTNDLLSNVHGGNRTGTIDQGKIHGILTVDFGKLAGWQGLSGFVNVFQIHNTGRMRRDYVGGINTIAAIEAVPATRLSEVWLEQKFASDTASLRVGQLAADAEFFTTNVGTLFLENDWPTIMAANLPSGGPAYPLSTPGARLKFDPIKDFSLLLAAFNGDPAGPGPGDEQLRNHHGLNFRLHDPAFIVGEVQFRANMGKEATGLARTLKVGGWTHLGQFDDQRFANDGSLLAGAAGSGMPAKHGGNYGVYAVVDQQLYRPRGGASDSGISMFARVSTSPSDRNLINAFLDAGVVFSGFVPNRPDDRFGASMMYARFSDAVRAFDRDTLALTGMGYVRDYEAGVEISYAAQIVPGWIVQPVLSGVWHPRGDSSRNAVVTGIRSQWRF